MGILEIKLSESTSMLGVGLFIDATAQVTHGLVNNPSSEVLKPVNQETHWFSKLDSQ